MHTEFEVRILEIKKEEFIKKLEDLNALLIDEWLQRRYVYDFNPKVAGKWIRLRTNGKNTTLAIKNIVTSKIDGTKELETKVGDFDITNNILKELGYIPKGYQENKRRQYTLNRVEIDIDDWPFIPTYVEIEGQDEDTVYQTLELLGFTKDDVTTKDVESIYLDYGYNLEEIYELKLEEERKW